MSRWRRFLRAILSAMLVLWMVVLLAGLHLPAPSGVSPANEEAVRDVWRAAAALAQHLSPFSTDSELIDGFGDDKALHVLLFLPLGLFWSLRRMLGRQTVIGVVIGGLLLVAVLSELLQLQGGRIADPLDVVANLLGATLGWLLAILFYQLGRRARAGWRRRTA